MAAGVAGIGTFSGAFLVRWQGRVKSADALRFPLGVMVSKLMNVACPSVGSCGLTNRDVLEVAGWMTKLSDDEN